ncbi:PIG-L family deacetylase [soil metagenome]
MRARLSVRDSPVTFVDARLSFMNDTNTTRDDEVLDIAELGTVLGIWAHPDDETYLTGGLCARLRDHGHRVVCVTATRGEAADPAAGPEARDALAAVRTSELEGALAMLGVSEHHWLDLPDGGCSDVPPSEPVERLTYLLNEVQPTTVITFGPDGFTGHPDHRTISSWVDLAVRHSSATTRALHPVAPPEPADAQLDEDFGVFELGRPRICTAEEMVVRLPLTGPELDRKVEALKHQVSQTADLIAAVGIERFRAWVSTEYLAEPDPHA